MKDTTHVTIDAKETGNKIRALIYLHDLTIQEFACSIGVKEVRTVNNWLFGKNPPSTVFVLAIMEVYNVDPCEFIVYKLIKTSDLLKD